MGPSGRSKPQPRPARWPYWLDFVVAALLVVGGVIIASSDDGFVDLSALGAGSILVGLVLGGLDLLVIFGQPGALKLRTGLALVVALASFALLLAPQERSADGSWAFSALGLPNFVCFWVGLVHLTRRKPS